MTTVLPRPSTKDINSSGLHPGESKALQERDPKPYEQPIITAIREMYTCKPTNTTFDIYAKDAVFHDPVGIARGVGSIKNQFKSLTQLFDKAEIPKMRVLEHPLASANNLLLIDQDVSYYRKANSSPTKTVNSLLTLQLDPNTHKVLIHKEEWDHNKTTTGEDGFFGWMNEQRKKLTADFVDVLEGGVNKN